MPAAVQAPMPAAVQAPALPIAAPPAAKSADPAFRLPVSAPVKAPPPVPGVQYEPVRHSTGKKPINSTALARVYKLTVVLSINEHQAVLAAAQHHGLPVSVWMRAAMFGEVSATRPHPENIGAGALSTQALLAAGYLSDADREKVEAVQIRATAERARQTDKIHRYRARKKAEKAAREARKQRKKAEKADP
jgi:hypothetical protein